MNLTINTTLIYPLAAQVALTFAVLVIMFKTRVREVQSGKITMKYFKTYDEGSLPEAIIKTERHFANLFEVPVLFYAAGIIAMILPVNGPFILFWAWLFVIARIVHAYIHIGSNKVKHRSKAFTLGLIAVTGMWVQVVLEAVSRGS
jgi:hypothetical protein